MYISDNNNNYNVYFWVWTEKQNSQALQSPFDGLPFFCSVLRGMRLESLSDDHFEYRSAFQTVSGFYSQLTTTKDKGEDESQESAVHSSGSSLSLFCWQVAGCCFFSVRMCVVPLASDMQRVISLPPLVICCLGAMVKHLETFNLQRVLSLTECVCVCVCNVLCLFILCQSPCLCVLSFFKKITWMTGKNTCFLRLI